MAFITGIQLRLQFELEKARKSRVCFKKSRLPSAVALKERQKVAPCEAIVITQIFSRNSVLPFCLRMQARESSPE